VRQDAEAEGEHEANRQGRHEGRHMLHGYTLTMNGAADNPQERRGFSRPISSLEAKRG
jgi:hypothetical protein